MTRELIDREEKKKSEERARGENNPDPTDPVAKMALERPARSWSVRHRGQCLSEIVRKVTTKSGGRYLIRIGANLRIRRREFR